MPWRLNRFRDCSDAYLTCSQRDDGGGAQISAQVTTMIYAGLTGARYAHSPLSNVSHGPAEASPEEWSGKWEKFFNLGLGHPLAKDLIASGYAVRDIRKPSRALLSRRTVHEVAHCNKVTHNQPAAWAKIAPDLRERYFSSPKPELEGFDPTQTNIALHVRRGDVGSEGRFSERFTDNGKILHFFDALKERIPSRNQPRFRLFSQGRAEDFSEFSSRGIELHLDTDVFTTFHHLVSADVLLVAKSSFSYLAGVIGGGICFMDRLGYPLLPGWHPFSPEISGNFDTAMQRKRP